MVNFYYYTISLIMFINVALIIYAFYDVYNSRLSNTLKVLLYIAEGMLLYDYVVALGFFNLDYVKKMTYDMSYIYSWYSHFIPLIIFQYIIISKFVKK